ncbi:MAG TPA: DUF433 domain-containing protein [Pyrinomonadaceae bacterium]|jgi:uncharacterized protein (DUF433 family)|nr:DUF433 domain-containing protein [Pyrinomonadaceae bacterium]
MSTGIATLLVSSPDVCGGRLRIDGTRITVNQIVVLHKQGTNTEEILETYPHLTLAQIYAALAYYHANQAEIEADLAAEPGTSEQANAVNGSLESEIRLEAFNALQRSLNLTPAKAAEWQDLIREARR